MAFEIDEKTKKKIIDLISILIPEAKIYLYGSRARGTNAEWSGIDIALDAGEGLSRHAVCEVRDIMEATNIPYIVDVIDIYWEPELMRAAIMKEKIIWKH